MGEHDKKRFLYITNYPLDSNSSAAIRNRAMIEGLIQSGYEAYTLTRKPSSEINIHNLEQYYFKNTSLAFSIAHKIKNNKSIFWKLRLILAKIISSINIFDNQRILLKGLHNINFVNVDFDFIISSSDSKVSHIIAERLIKNKAINTKQWIQYWGDPFYLDINKTTILPKILIKKEEQRILRKADYIFYTSPFTLEEQKRLYKEESDKMFFIPTPYLKERIYSPVYNKKSIIGYYGSYQKKDRNILPLYNVAKKMKHLNFQFIGSTDLTLENDSNICVLDRVKYSKILEYEEKCDILVCLANRESSSQIPGKLYHYAATNKPILLIYEHGKSEVAEYFKQFNRYYICENSEQAIKSELNNIISDPQIMPIPISVFDCKYIAKQVLKIIDA